MKKKQKTIPPLRKKTAQERLKAGLPVEPEGLTAALNWDKMCKRDPFDDQGTVEETS